MEADPVSETLLFSSYLEFQMTDKVQEPTDPDISSFLIYGEKAKDLFLREVMPLYILREAFLTKFLGIMMIPTTERDKKYNMFH
jgi:hypothetical protein